MKLEQKVHVREITVVKLGDRTLTHSGNSEDAVARSAGTRRPSDPGCSHREIWDKHLVLPLFCRDQLCTAVMEIRR